MIMTTYASIHQTLADLPASRVAFEVCAPTARLKEQFDRSINLPGVILTEGGRLFGAISRDALYRNLARPFCLELFLKRPILTFYEIWGEDVLRLAADCTIHQAAEQALSRTHEMAYEPILVTYADDTVGLIDVHAILIAQSQLLALSKEIEEQKEAAEAANRTKSEFLANISHELRTPLHGILSYSRFGLTDVEDADRGELREYFTNIDQCADTLLLLVNDLLDLAKLEAGRMTFDFEPVEINELLSAVVDEFRSLCSRQHIKVHFYPAASPPPTRLDANRIKQVVRNLMSNALKYTSESGDVYVRARAIKDAVLISVRDKGPGVPPGELEAIFDKFVQSSKTTSGQGGTGLGLAICREIVSGHRGRIWAENNSDAGCTFYCELPLGADQELGCERDEVVHV